MRLFLIGFWLVCVLPTATAAPQQKFPYDATVIEDRVDGVFVRSGPSREFYPTSKLKSGEKITIHRHDPGGWYMVAPPPGSFSWIRTEYVRRTGADLGILIENNVVVRVGSQFGDNHAVEQRRLSKGDEVRILGAKTLMDHGREIPMLKIHPPRGEFRWINGREIVPSAQAGQRNIVPDPFAQLSTIKSSATQSKSEKNSPSPFEPIEAPFDKGTKSSPLNNPSTTRDQLVERPMVRTGSGADLNAGSEISTQQRDLAWVRLKRLDAVFRDIIKRDTRAWNFSQLEKDYRGLRNRLANPTLIVELDRRLNALSRFKKIKQEHDELTHLTSETNRRDAQLLALQRQGPRQTNSKPIIESTLVAPDPATPRPHVATETGQSEPTRDRRAVRFDGAGIIQRSAIAYAGAPQHVLLAPGGRILAYLQSAPDPKGEPEINLELYLGRAVGVAGQRSYRADLQTDLILVRGLHPVRLKLQQNQVAR